MAKLDLLIPHLLYRESGVKDADPRRAFEKAAAKGVITLKGDRGGPTLAGVTLATYTEYCRRRGYPRPTELSLSRLGYERWLDITKSGFWDRCHGDEIQSQAVADMLVDWCYTSGINAIAWTQRALGVDTDGKVGPVTLATLNGPAAEVFAKVKAARTAYYRRIAVGANARFLNGWLNRTEAITLNGCNLR